MMPDGLPAGLDASADPIGTAPSMNSLMTPTKQETELQQEAISTGKEAASRLKSSAAMGTDLAKHLGEAPDPEKFGLSADDLHRAEPSKPPPNQPDTPLQDFGSIASLVGIFGGLRARKPLVASLNAAAGAMTALHQRNLEDFDQKVKEWRNNVDYVSKLMEWKEKAYDIADEKFKNDLAAKSAAYTMISAAAGDTTKAAEISRGNWQGVAQNRLDEAKIRAQLDATKAQLAETAQSHRDAMKAQADALAERTRHDKAQESGGADSLPKLAGQAAQLRAQADQLPENDPRKQQMLGIAASIDSAISKTKGAEAAPATLDDDAANLIADSWLNGNRQAAVGFGRSPANQTKIMNAIAAEAKDKNISGPMISAMQAVYQGEVAGQRTLGTRAANMEVAANEVDLMAPLALEASQKVDRTKFPSLNSVILSAEKGTGGEDVVQFGLAANSLIYTYAKFLNPTGIPTDADKARASEILDTAWSKGQFSAAITQIKREITSGQAAISSTKGEISRLVTGETSPQNPATPGTKAEYDRLAPGSYYRKPDDPIGTVRQKP